MKIIKQLLLSLGCAILLSFNLSAQEPQKLIISTALDYAEGYYSGDAVRMQRALHYDLNKGNPRYIQRTGKISISYSTFSSLVDVTREKLGLLADTARHLSVKILFNDSDIALVKVNSSMFNDYLQEIRTDEGWKIINVLWNSPQNAGWLKNLTATDEQKDIKTAVSEYLTGLQRGDVSRLQKVISEDYNRISFAPINAAGKVIVQRTRYDAIVENVFAGFGRREETQRNNEIQILDVMDGMAMVTASSMTTIEYLQLYRDTEGWKVFNSILTARDVKFTELVPPIIGEPMPDFTLPVHGGGDFNMSAHKGKNVLLMFPRGWTGNQWCLFCPYQYLDLSMLEQKEHFMKKYNLDVVFVMPYSNERIDQWFSDFPKAVAAMDRMKGNAKTGTGMQKQFGEWVVTHFPNSFEFKDGAVEKTFPVLCDENQTLSKRLYLYTGFWDGITADQNVSAIYLIDKTGKLRWKYVSQITEDRPSTEYLMETVKSYCR